MLFALLKVKLPNMTDWHILPGPGLKILVLIACCRLPVNPQNSESSSRYSASGPLQKFAADLSLSTPQNSQPCKIVTLSLNSNQNLHTPAPLIHALQANDLKFLLSHSIRKLSCNILTHIIDIAYERQYLVR